jgi:hypothetical protein
MMCKWKGEKWRKEKEIGLKVLFKELYEIIIKEIKKCNTEDEGRRCKINNSLLNFNRGLHNSSHNNNNNNLNTALYE